jgi:hypothetical protein
VKQTKLDVWEWLAQIQTSVARASIDNGPCEVSI